MDNAGTGKKQTETRCLETPHSSPTPPRVTDEKRVYFIRCGEFVKIGFSVRPEERLEVIQSVMPHEVVLIGHIPGARRRERELHTRFAHLHHRGEWFRLEPELRKAISTLIRGKGGSKPYGGPSKRFLEKIRALARQREAQSNMHQME